MRAIAGVVCADRRASLGRRLEDSVRSCGSCETAGRDVCSAPLSRGRGRGGSARWGPAMVGFAAELRPDSTGDVTSGLNRFGASGGSFWARERIGSTGARCGFLGGMLDFPPGEVHARLGVGRARPFVALLAREHGIAGRAPVRSPRPSPPGRATDQRWPIARSGQWQSESTWGTSRFPRRKRN